MQLTRIHLENWRNFRQVDVPLGTRVFVVGPNASGKSNLLDAIRFLRAVAEAGGGLARAIQHPSRRGVSQIRCLHGRANPSVLVEVEARSDDGQLWNYLLEFRKDRKRPFYVEREVVRRDGEQLLSRPDDDDRA